MKCLFNKCELEASAKEYCQGHYMQQRRGQKLSPLYNHLSLKDRIESKIEKDDSGCFIWTGHVDTGGYPNIKFQGKNYLVHRSYYKIVVEDIQKHNTLDHLCRNKLCINPDHLQPVSRSENVKRMQIGRFYETEIARLVDFIESLGYDSQTLLPKE
jgi:HNH endonuclease